MSGAGSWGLVRWGLDKCWWGGVSWWGGYLNRAVEMVKNAGQGASGAYRTVKTVLAVGEIGLTCDFGV